MAGNKKYASYADFERDEYLCVKSFYSNLEDLMEDELFSHYEDSYDTENGKKKDMMEELEF